MKQHQLDGDKEAKDGENVGPLSLGNNAIETNYVGQQMRGDQQQ